MFNKDDFDLPLESQLRLRVINDEIDKAKDVQAIKDNLKQTSKLIMFYQHLLSRLAKDMITKDMNDWLKPSPE